MSRARTITLVGAAAALVAAGCEGTDLDKAGGAPKHKVQVLTMANGDQRPEALKPFAAAVRRLSGGTLRIEFKNGWRKGTPDVQPHVIRDVRAGRIDLAWAGPRAFDGADVRSVDALLAPVLIESYPLLQKVLAGPIADAMLDGIEPLGVVGLGILPGPMRNPLAVDRKDRSAAFSVSEVMPGPDPIAELMFEILGGISPTNEYIATNVNLWPRTKVVFMNRTRFASLDDSQREALRGAARSALADTVAFERDDEQQWAATLCRNGLSFVRPSGDRLVRFRRRLQPVYEQLERDALTRTTIAQITAMRDEDPVIAESDAPECGPPDPQSRITSQRTPVDGVYRMTTPREEWRLVLDRGRLEYTQSSDDGERWTKGVYTVKGQMMTWRITAYGGDVPNSDGERTGDVVAFHWNRYRDLLLLEPVAGKVSPARLRVKAWRRGS